MLTVDLITSVVVLLSNAAVTLLTILLPVYALGISLVGPSATRRKEEMNKINAEETEATKSAIEKAEEALKGSKTDEAQKRLDELTAKKQELQEKKKDSESRSQSLKLKYSLLYPSILLLSGAAVMRVCVVLMERATNGHEWNWVYLAIAAIGAIVGIALLGRALWRVGRTFLLIEALGLRVSEFNRQELRSVLEEVLRERDKAKAVQLRLGWKENTPPFRFHPGEKFDIRYELGLSAGGVANDARVWFLLPPGFGFEELSSWSQGTDRGEIANYVTAEVKHGKVLEGIWNLSRIRIVGSSEPGDYKAFYQIVSDEYAAKRESFRVVIEKGA